MRAILIISLVWVCNTVSAQLYEAQPIQPNREIRGMYYDSVTEKSYIYGGFKTVNGDSANVVEYDGTNYNLLPLAPLHNIWTMIRYKDKLYASSLYGLVVWDGTAWFVIDNIGVLNMKVIDDKLYVMGYIDTICGVPCRGVAIWNDTVWSGLPDIATVFPSGSGSVSDIAYYKGNIYVGGNFFDAAYPELQDMMMYDGTSWQPVGSFVGSGLGGVKRMIEWRDTLYVCGMYLESEGNPGNNIAAWDGTNWHRLQEGVNALGGSAGGSVITDMHIYNDELWVAGSFRVINGSFIDDGRHKNLAKWDGTQWCTMNLWMESIINSLTGFGTWKDEFFVLGSYIWSEDTSAMHILKWVGGDYTDTCIQSLPTNIEENSKNNLELSVYPNPASDEFTVRFVNDGSIKNGEEVTIQIYDIQGREIYISKWKILPSINQFKINTEGIASGTYMISIKGDNTNSAAKFMKL